MGNQRFLFTALFLFLSFLCLNSQTVSPKTLVQAMLTGKDSLWLPKRSQDFQKSMSEERVLQTLRLFSPLSQPLTTDTGECLFKGMPSLYRFHLSKTNPEQYFFLSLRMKEDSIAGLWIQPTGPKVIPEHKPAWAESLPKPEQIWIPFERGAFAAYLFRPEIENPQKPLVYLLAGSGPQDAFSTTGPNQPLKELAERLQWQGFTVLLHPKVSVFLPEFLSQNPKAGLQEEYEAPANAVFSWLNHSSLQNVPVFLAGHSLGGVMAPWMAKSKPQVKGVLGIAAPSTPLYFLIPKQLRFLAKKSGQWKNSVARGQIQSISREMSLFHRTGQMKKSPLQGVPIAYWESVRAYAVEKSKKFSPVPHVFVGGTSDNQVPISEIKGWKKWIPQANFIYVKNMDHLLRISPQGAGPESYKSYIPVDTLLVDRLAQWMLQTLEEQRP